MSNEISSLPFTTNRDTKIFRSSNSYETPLIRAYKIQLTQKLKPADYEKNRMFSRWILDKQLDDDDFKQMIFSDEVHENVVSSTNKTVTFRGQKILVKFKKEKCIYIVLLCDLHFEQRASSIPFSLMMRGDKLSYLMMKDTATRSLIFCSLILKIWTLQNCCFSGVMPPSTVQQRPLDCCKRCSRVASLRDKVMLTGQQGHVISLLMIFFFGNLSNPRFTQQI